MVPNGSVGSMSEAPRRRREDLIVPRPSPLFRLRPAAAVLVVGLALAACSGSDGSTAASATPSVRSSPTAAAPVAPPSELEVLEIGHIDRLYSVLVRNPDATRGLREASFVLVAEHADGRLVRYAERVPPGTPDTCCVIELLPPGEVYGLFFDIGDDQQDIDTVTVTVEPSAFVSFAGATDVALAATPGAISTRTEAGREVTVAAVSVRTEVPVLEPVNSVVQPVLEDADGALLAIIGARVRCVPAGGKARSVDLSLPLQAPEGARLREVLAYSAVSDTTAC